MWACDSAVDSVNDQLVKLAVLVYFEKKLDEEGFKRFQDIIRATALIVNKRLTQHGKDFVVGDKITIADFMACSLLFTTAHN